MAVQNKLASCFAVAVLGTVLRFLLFDEVLQPFILFSTFQALFWGQAILSLAFLAFISPHLSPLRHLPTAPQAPLHKRLFKEPNAFHFEKWINEVPNDGAIRYFGIFNGERLLFTGAEGVRQILQTEAYNFEKPLVQRTTLSRIADNGLVVREGDVHKLQRRVLNPAFKFSSVKDIFMPIIWSKTNEMLEVMANNMTPTDDKELSGEGIKPNSSTLSMTDIIGRAAFDTIGLAAFGHNFQSLAAPDTFYYPHIHYRKAFEPSPSMRLRMLFAMTLPAWLVNILPIEANRITSPSINSVRNFFRQVIVKKKQARLRPDLEKHIDSASVEPKPVMLDTILDAGKLTDRELLDQAMMIQAGGIHTVHAGMMSAVWFLSQPENHHVQDRLRAEIRANIPAYTPYTTLPYSTFDHTPYLDAVLQEVLRLQSAISWMGRTPIKPVNICGIPIPTGSFLSISPWALHRSFELWGQDSKEFKPDRWLDGKETIPRDSHAYIPFGAGPRTCIGEKFAKAEMNCLLAGIFGRFRLTFEEGQSLPRVTHQVTLAFRDDMKVRAEVVEGW